MPTRRFDFFACSLSFVARISLHRISLCRRSLLTAVLLLILLPMATPEPFILLAQEDVSPIDETIEGLANWGPLFWKTRLRLKDAGYDNNLYHGSDEQVGSYTATLTPGIDLFLPMGKRQILSGSEDLDFVFYAEDPPGIYFNNAASIGYDLYLRRIHLSLGDENITRLQRPNDEIDARVRRMNNALSGELTFDLSPRVDLGLTHDSDRIRYDDQSIEDPGAPDGIAMILDRTERRNGLLMRYAALPRTTFLLKVRHTDYDFNDPESTRESSEMRYLVGAEFDPTGILNGELEVGHSSFTADLAPEQDFQGFVGRGEVTWKTKTWLHLKVTAERDRRFSTYATNLFYLRRRLGGRVSVRMGGAGWLDLGYGWDGSDYPVADVNTGTEEAPILVSRQDRFTSPILGFRYLPREGVLIGIEAKYRSRTSNYTRDYDRLFVAVTISLTK